MNVPYRSTNPITSMAFPFKLRTRILLSTPRSYLVTPEGSTCPLKLTGDQRDKIANSWSKVQDFHRIGQANGTLYSQPST